VTRSKTPEGEIKKPIILYLNTLGAVVMPLHTGMTRLPGGIYRTPASSRGRADIIMLHNSLVIAIEVKTDSRDSKQRPGQIEWEQRWVANGGIYWVVRSLQEVIDNLGELVRSYG